MNVVNRYPLVSVLIPCYNSEKFVEQAVRSIMGQTYKNLEIIAINDCSSDRTGEILQRLASEDSRILYIENKINLKLAKTLNKAIDLARGDFIARMDADDISLKKRIEVQINYLLKHQDIDLVSAYALKINMLGELGGFIKVPIMHSEIASILPMRSTFVHPLVLAKKSFFIDLGFYRDISYGEDYDLWIRGLICNKKYANIPEVLLYYRLHDGQMTDWSYNRKNAKSIQDFLLNYFLETRNAKFILGYFFQTKIYYSLRNFLR